MQRFDKKAHWQKIYEAKKTSELTWFQTEPTVSLELIAKCNLKLSEPVIDVGGGSSLLVDHLLERGYTKLAVLDISEAALSASRQRLGVNAERIKWIESDITVYKPRAQVALWHDRAVFHFLTDAEDRNKYVATLKQTLPVGGHLIIASFAIGGPEKCSGLPIVQYDSQKLLSELGTDFKLLAEQTENHITPAQRIQEFTYFYLVRVANSEQT